MGFLSWIFGDKSNIKPEKNTSHSQENVDRTIKFHPDLVEKLTGDHQAIVALYSEMVELVQIRQYHSLSLKVSEFKTALQSHVIVENVQFYTYLENKLSDDPTNLEFIKDVRKEMNGIAHAVVRFAKQYEKVTFTDQLRETFIKDLDDIGTVLTKRVAMEESQLYTLYN